MYQEATLDVKGGQNNKQVALYLYWFHLDSDRGSRLRRAGENAQPAAGPRELLVERKQEVEARFGQLDWFLVFLPELVLGGWLSVVDR